MTDYEVAIIGAGIAGASLAAELNIGGKVLLLEAEAHPGYHATGRSAAFWTESYGGPLVQPLTTASGPFLFNPPAEYSDRPFVKQRGALYIGTKNDTHHAEALRNDFARSGVRINQIECKKLQHLVPGIKPEWMIGFWEPDCCDIDVAALHAAYLRKFRRDGGQVACNTKLQKADYARGKWTIETASENFTAKILVNAAGAWADEVAMISGVSSIGIRPFRRTIAQLEIAPNAPTELPLVIGLDSSFYFKPDAGGRLWLSPHDETPMKPCDVAPEEIDVAVAIDRLSDITDWEVQRVEHKWAGLRSFAPDRLPVFGFDHHNEAFFWLAGQGGFGIQTAPAIASLAASMILRMSIDNANIDHTLYDPKRFSDA
jgi:D-arginine dehydrogenase